MDNITEDLFLKVSQKVNVRVTPDTLRTKMEAVSATGGVNAKIKTDILIELLLAFAELEKKIDATRITQNPSSV